MGWFGASSRGDARLRRNVESGRRLPMNRGERRRAARELAHPDSPRGSPDDPAGVFCPECGKVVPLAEWHEWVGPVPPPSGKHGRVGARGGVT